MYPRIEVTVQEKKDTNPRLELSQVPSLNENSTCITEIRRIGDI